MKRVNKSKVSTFEQRVEANAIIIGSKAVVYGDKAYRIGSAGLRGLITGLKQGYNETRR